MTTKPTPNQRVSPSAETPRSDNLASIAAWLRAAVVGGLIATILGCTLLGWAWLRVGAVATLTVEQEAERDAVRRELAELRQGLSRDKTELSSVRAELDAVTTALAENRAARAAVENQHASLSRSLTSLREETAALSQKRDGLKEQINSVANADARLEALRKRHEKTLAETRSATAELALKQDELALLTAQISRHKGLAQEQEKLLEEVVGLRKERDMIQSERARLDKETKVLKEENQALVTQYGQLKSSVLQAQRKLAEMFRYLEQGEGRKQ